MNIDRLTPDDEILKELGARLTRVRKQQSQSQEALAREAGIGVATLRRVEDGNDSQLSSWLKILKALELEGTINSLLPESFHSPMEEALTQKKRSSKRAAKAFKWGDEES
ncbi:MAG: transcriptional regulator with XRE-family HTH domain [Planctomycetota bacterium]|jgi:transcriptional regulator with XRE-family HTH domain